MVMIPPKPRTIWRDVRSFFGRRERHNWIFIAPSIAVPFGILWVFTTEVGANLLPEDPPITYAYVWEEGRSDDQIIERQRGLALAENERRALIRERFRQLAEASGIEIDEEAAAEADRITEDNRRRLSRDDDADEAGESRAENGASEADTATN